MIPCLLLLGGSLTIAVLASLVLAAREMGWVRIDVVSIEVKVISISSRRGQ